MKPNPKNESGRSMVEMLGVLAVIGVLSLMGVVGYKMAMTRFRTNELLDHASKHAALIAMQIANGSTSPALEDLGGNSVSGMTFNSVSYPNGSDTFDLVITGVPDEVATQIQNQVGGNSIIRDINFVDSTSTLTLTFNKDLSAESGNNSGTNSGEEQPEDDSCVGVVANDILLSASGICPDSCENKYFCIGEGAGTVYKCRKGQTPEMIGVCMEGGHTTLSSSLSEVCSEFD